MFFVLMSYKTAESPAPLEQFLRVIWKAVFQATVFSSVQIKLFSREFPGGSVVTTP